MGQLADTIDRHTAIRALISKGVDLSQENVLKSVFDESKHPRNPNGRFRRLFHATNAKLKPGDVVTSAQEGGHSANFNAFTDAYEGDRAYAFDARNGESLDQGFGEHVYEVKAGTVVQPDNEQFLPEYEEERMGRDSWTAKRFKVIRELGAQEKADMLAGKHKAKTFNQKLPKRYLS